MTTQTIQPPSFSEPATGTIGSQPANNSAKNTKRANPSSHPQLQDARTDLNVVFIHSELDDYGLNPSQFRVYCHLARRASSGKAWPSLPNIARTCHIHEQTARMALTVLVDRCLLAKESRPGKTAFYRINPRSSWKPARRIKLHPYENDTPLPNSYPTPTKPIQGYPYEKNTHEGNPLEGNPLEGYPPKNTPPPTSGLPCGEEDAIARADAVGVPAEFARHEFLAKSAEGWRSGYGNPITLWENHIRVRWNTAQQKHSKDNRPATDKLHPAVIDKQLKEVLRKIKELEGADPQDPGRRANLRRLRQREQELSEQLISSGATLTQRKHPVSPHDELLEFRDFMDQLKDPKTQVGGLLRDLMKLKTLASHRYITEAELDRAENVAKELHYAAPQFAGTSAPMTRCEPPPCGATTPPIPSPVAPGARWVTGAWSDGGGKSARPHGPG